MRPHPGQRRHHRHELTEPHRLTAAPAPPCTSRVRSPFGSGVREMRIVSPMPCWSRMPMAADEGDDALRAHCRLPSARDAGRGRTAARVACRQRSRSWTWLTLADRMILVAGQARFPRPARPRSAADWTIASRVTSCAVSGNPFSWFWSMRAGSGAPGRASPS